mmetsp:Transcript_4268/g.9480  ORF Transcript_4268/g.9480 Transcript_4268/m.9480 type:complete len:962 (+) Transcript_4268:139-3024(+)
MFSRRFHTVTVLVSLISLLLPAAVVDGRSVLGVDLGSTYMKVALVRSGSPLEIVTNLHSKRKTEQMILFDQQQRFYGADANGLLQRKAQFTPTSMTEMLGRDLSHPNVQAMIDRHFPVQPTYNETRKGLSVEVPKAGTFTPEELVAMVLQHAVEISVAYAKEAGSDIPPPSDIVMTVPAYATQIERKAILDAAELAGLNVLTLIDETTAAALHYAMDKNFEEEKIFLYYNMGATSLQVSIVKLFQYELKSGLGKPKPVPALQVLAKTWDNTLGGLAWDQALVDHMVEEFNKSWQKASGDDSKDIRTVQRPMTKMRIAANKAKHVLSANTEYPINMDSLHDGVSLNMRVTREDFEKMTAPLLERAAKPVADALAAAELTISDLTGVELLGGGMRVPSVQAKLKEVLDPVVLGLHMNADESMALGAAFGGANVSTAFRVRPVGMVDITPFSQQISLSNLPAGEAEEEGKSGGWFQSSKKKEEETKDDDEQEEEEWNKKATLFKANSKVGVKKTIAFTHDKDVHCALDYSEADRHVEGQSMALERYEIGGVADFTKEIAEKGLEGKPKISLQFELSPSGITSLIKAEASIEETYTVEEEVEVDDDEDDEDANSTESATEESKDSEETAETEAEEKSEDKDEDASGDSENKTSDGEATKEDDKKTEEKPKKKKKVMVEKEKKRLHKRSLKVSTYYESDVQPHWADLLDESKAKLLEMDEKDKERVMLEESKNRVESYMFMVKNKLIDDEEEIATVSTEEQREECRKLAVDTEEWLEDDGYSADFPTMEDKYAELSAPFEKILLRLKEKTARPDMIEKVEKVLTKAEELLKKWETTMPQVTEEERGEVTEKIEGARTAIKELEEAQAAKEPHEDPAYMSAELVSKVTPVEKLMQRLSKKPKPKPQKKANETKSDNATDTNSTDSNATAEETTESSTDEESTADESDDSAKADEDADDADEESDDEL